MAATVAFAVTAVLAIESDRDIDLFGATVLGLITAIGGGTIRDVIIDAPVFWAADLAYVWVGCAASVLAFYGRRLFSKRHLYLLMLYLDGFGAAMFGIQATGKVWDLGFGLPAAPVVLGGRHSHRRRPCARCPRREDDTLDAPRAARGACHDGLFRLRAGVDLPARAPFRGLHRLHTRDLRPACRSHPLEPPDARFCAAYAGYRCLTGRSHGLPHLQGDSKGKAPIAPPVRRDFWR
jgi:hypothetical protein